MRLFALIALACLVFTAPATAREPVYCPADQTYRQTCGKVDSRIQSQISASGGVIVGTRPAGCPYKFCGCVASLYVFGEIRPELNLAANWKRKFPHTSPAPGMVAARNGHVMVLMSHASGDEWMVHDGNSGGGKTREHVRSIRGYTIVNPRAQVASR